MDQLLRAKKVVEYAEMLRNEWCDLFEVAKPAADTNFTKSLPAVVHGIFEGVRCLSCVLYCLLRRPRHIQTVLSAFYFNTFCLHKANRQLLDCIVVVMPFLCLNKKWLEYKAQNKTNAHYICLQHGFSCLKLLVTVTVLDINHGSHV